MTETPTQDPVDERALWSEIDALTEANRRSRDPEVEQRLAALRHQAGIELVKDPPSDPSFVEPDFDQLDESSDLPEVTPEQLTPELVRAAILSKGCLLVRGLLDRDDATEMAAEIERAFETRYSLPEGEQSDDGYYYEMKPIPPYTLQARGFVKNSGGIWAPDSPKVLFDVLDAFERNGLGELAEAYLGERPAITVQKCTLRQVSPDAGNGFPGWHQDGAFLGDVRSLNVWLNLTRCGDGSAPGLDLLPRRLDEIVPTGTDGAVFDWVVSPKMVEQVADGAPILSPVFEPGDMLLFDDLFLHGTAADPKMPKNRYAVESWFFGPSAFPDNYLPFAF